MLKPEMAYGGSRKRRRSHSYFSGFTQAFATLQARPISKARSAEKLVEVQLDPRKRAHSTRDLSRSSRDPELEASSLSRLAARLEVEKELELRVQTLSRSRKFKEVTVPTSIKFAVWQETPSDSDSEAMARPRSPSKSGCDTDLLDQTLLNIRRRLTSLSSDRAEMENKMDELITGIKAVHMQCCNQLQLQHQQQMAQNSPQAHMFNSIRRVRSSATPAKKPTYLSMAASPSPSSCSQSQECLANSPNLSQDTIGSSALSASSQPSLNSQPMHRQRSESAAASLRYRSIKPPSLSLSFHSTSSCSNIDESWIPTTTIHELPESPKMKSLSGSSGSLHCYKIQTTTTPATKNDGYRRSVSVSSPSSCASTPEQRRFSNMLTSTPDIAEPPHEKKDYYYTLPNIHLAHKNSLPDTAVMGTTIPEDQVDNASTPDNLSQLSNCTDDGSPRSGGSTLIVRRSSLTGQLEYRKPRPLSKKISASTDLCEKRLSKEEESWSRNRSRMNSCTGTSETEYRVLNRGVRKSNHRRRSTRFSQIILPSIETTV